MRTNRIHPLSTGYTLVELAMTLLVIGLLASMAVSSYRDSLIKTRRGEAQASLTQLQLQQERWRALNPSYANANELGLSQQPRDGRYEWSVPVANATSYVLRATATSIGAQNRDHQWPIDCKVLEVDQAGQRHPSECWR
jgi:type IV pilus assembly protein PilE